MRIEKLKNKKVYIIKNKEDYWLADNLCALYMETTPNKKDITNFIKNKNKNNQKICCYNCKYFLPVINHNFFGVCLKEMEYKSAFESCLK